MAKYLSQIIKNPFAENFSPQRKTFPTAVKLSCFCGKLVIFAQNQNVFRKNIEIHKKNPLWGQVFRQGTFL
jgi:hypothetical protein